MGGPTQRRSLGALLSGERLGGLLLLTAACGVAGALLTASLLVNPHDADEVAEALDRALRMSLAERTERWQDDWRVIEGTSALAWGRSFLAALLRTALSPTASARVAANGGSGTADGSLGIGVASNGSNRAPGGPHQRLI